MDRPKTANDGNFRRRGLSELQFPTFRDAATDDLLHDPPTEGALNRVSSFLHVMSRSRGVTARQRHNSFRESTNRSETIGSLGLGEEVRRWTRRPSIKMSIFGRSVFSQRLPDDTVIDDKDSHVAASSLHPGWLQRVAAKFKQWPGLRDDTNTILGNNVCQDSSADTIIYEEEGMSGWSFSGGAAARAAAAAQNEFFWPGYKGELSRIRDLKDSNDSESGIGIDVQGYTDGALETGSVIVRRDPAYTLPEELFALLLSFLDASSLMNAEQVSQRWYHTASSRHLWKNIFVNEFGYVSTRDSVNQRSGGSGLGLRKPHQQWKKMWKARKLLQSRWSDGHAAAIYLEGHQDTVYCVQFDEHKILTGSRDRTIRIWDAHTFECIKILGKPKPTANHNTLAPLIRSSRGHRPFTAFGSPKPENFLEPCAAHPSLTHFGSILCLQFDGEIVVTGSSDTTLIIWSILQDYKPTQRLRHHKMGVLDVCFDDRYIVSCSKDTTICLWSRSTGELIRQLSGHRGPVNAVQLRGSLIVSASGDGVAKLWNIASGMCVKEFASRDRGLACVEFSPDCRMIFAGGNDQLIYQFDAATGELVREFSGHGNLVRSLHLDAQNGRMISGSYDHSIKVYDTTNGNKMCDFSGWTTSWMLAAKADYRRIVATSQDRRVVIIDFGYDLPDVDLLAGSKSLC